ncbi:MAG: SURF1 family protein [Rickettsiales bacterium]|nr:SURF1 family protein [Rickettsiales bacterium]
MLKRLIPWIFIAGTVGVLVGLGSWQMQRLAWKDQLLAQYETGKTLPALELSAIASQDLNNNAYRHLKFSGKFMHDKEVHLGGRRWHGKTGYQVLTPMKMKDGRIFLVNRGWIPFELKDQEKRADSIAQSHASLTAVLRIPKQAQLFTPENHPKKNFWFTVDVPAITEFTGVTPEPVMLEVIEAEPDINAFPIPSDGVRVFRNDHLGYALTWYALALGALIMFWARVLRQPKN